MVRIALLFLTLLMPAIAFAQQHGCTDTTALNYNSEAVVNDGSCIYQSISIKPPVLLKKLPRKVFETSGLIWWRGSYWTHNDSGGENEIYRLDSLTGKIIQTVRIQNAINVDWEDIDQDDDYIYIGDFGNNLGNRTDLTIYKLPKINIDNSENDTIAAEVISFSFGDQQEYSIRNRSHNHDCEAMISYGESLYLFSKDWADQRCRLYSLPKNQGSYTVFPLSEFNSDGLVTGAALDHDANRIVLCGYRNYIPFVWILSDFTTTDFFGGNKRRVDFRELPATQTEGITCRSIGVFSISAERTKINRAKIFTLDLKEIP